MGQVSVGVDTFLSDSTRSEQLNLVANRALLEKIGPAVFLTHSQSGPFGFEIADARPDLVKGLVSVEPNGPPFKDLYYDKKDPWFSYRDAIARPYGITRLPLAFDPPVSGAGLSMATLKSPRPNELVPCFVQAEPVHRLPRLGTVPILILTGEASFRAPYDYCTSQFLTQAGVANTSIELGAVGVHGNSHMMMLEKNNRSSAEVIMNWLRSNVR